MPPEPSKPSVETGLIIQPGAGLVTLPHGGSPALSEIINRAIVHIRSSKSQAPCQREPGEVVEFEIVDGVMMKMRWIPPGEFLMGSPEGEAGYRDDEVQHQVRITQGFWLAETPTTQAQWWAVMGNYPSDEKGDDSPVDSVSWNDICGMEGFLVKLDCFTASDKLFHLPTEAQWEYACRAGTLGPYAVGGIEGMGWSYGNGEFKSHQVAKRKANAWGLHDMHGNVWEWCSDWYGRYSANGTTDPTGPSVGSHRVIRGGSWISVRSDCRAARRDCADPSHAFSSVGFRVVRSSLTENAAKE